MVSGCVVFHFVRNFQIVFQSGCVILHFCQPCKSDPVSLSSVQSLSCVRLFVTPWTAARQASLSFTISWRLLRLMSIESVMPSNRLILCHPLLLLPSIFPSRNAFPYVILMFSWARGTVCAHLTCKETEVTHFISSKPKNWESNSGLTAKPIFPFHVIQLSFIGIQWTLKRSQAMSSIQ